MKTAVYNLAGEKTEELELNPYLFEVKPKSGVVHQAMMAQGSNRRQVLAHTKTKGEVRGGGRKPWKQKGTGRARQGSIRNPQWKGGGVAFGPRKERNFKVKINKKVKNLALRMVLSDKAKDNNLIILDQWNLAEEKTKKLLAALNQLPIKDSKTVIALAKNDPKLIRLAANLPKVFVTGAGSLNVVDLLNHKYLLISKAALSEVEKVYGKK